MSHDNSQIYRTTPARTGKMLAIMLGICIVGGVIFFSMWDYWISAPPPVVAMMAGEAESTAPAAATGKTIQQDIQFIESSDFRTLAFNALPGEDGHNPVIHMSVGDKVVFTVENDGKSFHSFGVTKSDEGFTGIISGSEIGTASNPLKPGQGGTSEFIAGEEGTYYYICTVPGHREQGMVGEIIVDSSQGSNSSTKAAAPTGIHHDFSVNFIESSDFRTLAFNALPGEDGHNPEFQVNSGDEITFTATNNGKSFHSFGIVSNPENPNSVLWDSGIAAATNPLKPTESGESTFIAGAPGTYYYICTVPGHALQGMSGKIIVGDGSTEVMEPEVVEEVMEPESTPVEFSGVISIPEGSGTPGCDDTNECFIPFNVSVSTGEEITWSNDDSAAHTVTSGTPADGPDGNFDSSLFMAGSTFSVTLDEAGEYPYFCMVHPWMTGNITVN